MIAAGFIASLLLLLALANQLLRRYRPLDDDPLVTTIDLALPQTQCAQCGFPGCRPYAQAVAANTAPTNLCAPGGAELIEVLNGIVGAPETPQTIPLLSHTERAFIREAECIGCTLCIAPCPVDAIVGGPGYSHSVITNQCTGCELCIPACPVDCIEMQPSNEVDSPPWQPPPSPACIRCGACNTACPVGLPAQVLLELVQLKQWSAADDLNLSRCIECGLCDEACPAEIPLEAHFAAGKQKLSKLAAEHTTREQLKSRFEEHTRRHERIQREQESKRSSRLTQKSPWQR